MPSATYAMFLDRVRELSTWGQIGSLLGWDQETYMPPKAVHDRANQIAAIAGLAHEKLVSDEMGKLLTELRGEIGDATAGTKAGDADGVVAANVREVRRSYDRAVKLPTALVQEIARESSLAQEAWRVARAGSDFARFAPHLEKLLDLKREVADRFGWDTEPYDALLDEFEPGARAADIQTIFDALKKELVPLVAALAKAPRQPDQSILKRSCPVAQQETFNRRVLERMGFDFQAGRIDRSAHPFCSGTTPSDVRLTTRYDEHYFPMSLFGSMHEAGHGLYEQGFDPIHTGTPMAQAVSLGIHESQSRLWENMVGRSRPFWEHWLPEFQQTFTNIAGVPVDDFVRAINTVRPSFIRVEADEVTYGLHIMLRFDLERQMIAGKLPVASVPERWDALFKEYFGLTPPSVADGCLQDIHWSLSIFGYFPTYQLGNLYAAQFFAAARRARPDLDGQLRRGELAPLRAWLRENIHRHGMRYRAHELVERVTGSKPSHAAYVQYLHAKYKPLYGL